MDYIMATSWLYGDNPPPPPPPENEYTINSEEQQGEEVDEGKEKSVPLPAATAEKSTKTEEVPSKKPMELDTDTLLYLLLPSQTAHSSPETDDDETPAGEKLVIKQELEGGDVAPATGKNNNSNHISSEQPPPIAAAGGANAGALGSGWMPMLDYLCTLNGGCSLKELQVLLTNLDRRRWMLAHLRQSRIVTTHLQRGVPSGQQEVRCDDLSAQNANVIYAFHGYLSITVRQYLFARYRVVLRHPYLPCVIEYGGPIRRHFHYVGDGMCNSSNGGGRKRTSYGIGGSGVAIREQHASFYPLELLSVYVGAPTAPPLPPAPQTPIRLLQRGVNGCGPSNQQQPHATTVQKKVKEEEEEEEYSGW